MSDYKRRVGELVVQEDMYCEGLLNLVGYLCIELSDLLYEEGKYYGPIRVINAEFSKVWGLNPSNIPIYNKILYLYRPRLEEEYRRLKKRRLSPSESMIIIVRKIIYIVSENSNNPYPKEVFEVIQTQIGKLYAEITCKSKKDSLFGLCCMIRDCIENGDVGKYEIDDIRLEIPDVEKTEYTGSSSIENVGEDSGITIVTWNV